MQGIHPGKNQNQKAGGAADHEISTHTIVPFCREQRTAEKTVKAQLHCNLQLQ